MHPLTPKFFLRRKIRCRSEGKNYSLRTPCPLLDAAVLFYMNNKELINKLNSEKFLSHAQWRDLISDFSSDDAEYAGKIAEDITKANFGNKIFFRGIIEFSNICKNDCLYCGIRCSNKKVTRYRLTDDEILLCCREGYRLGYRTFVLQGGESEYTASTHFTDLIKKIKTEFSDCALTLSVGECSRDVYEKMFEAGADRYLLRHETADKSHYEKLHPVKMSFDNRIRCLHELKDIGFQTGCGMMVGTPFQNPDTLAEDMEFMSLFQPAMVGTGPFIPHSGTPFAEFEQGSIKLTLFLLSLTRIMFPHVLLPATTALGTVRQDGRIKGVLAGCNVVMPNLSPQNIRKNYMLYDNKTGTGLSAEDSLILLKKQMESIGRTVVTGRGDHKDYERTEI